MPTKVYQKKIEETGARPQPPAEQAPPQTPESQSLVELEHQPIAELHTWKINVKRVVARKPELTNEGHRGIS